MPAFEKTSSASKRLPIHVFIDGENDLCYNSHVCLYIQVSRHGSKLLFIALQSLVRKPFALREVRKSEKVSSMVAAQFNLIFFIIPDLLIFKISIKNQAHRHKKRILRFFHFWIRKNLEIK